MILKGGRSEFSQSRRGRCRLELVRAGRRCRVQGGRVIAWP